MSARFRNALRPCAALAIGCAPAPPSLLPPSTVPAAPLEIESAKLEAERITADFAVLEVPVGDLELLVCPATDTREATIESKIQPASLIRAVRALGGDARTVLGAGGVAPASTETHVHDGDTKRTYRIRYAPGSFSYEFEKTGEEPKRGTRKLDGGTAIHDLHSALALLRAWRPAFDERAEFFVVLGRRLWRVEARSAGRKTILIRGAPRVTTRIDGEARRVDATDTSDPANRRTFSVWLEEGQRAVPVQIAATGGYGDVMMTLTRYERSPELCGL